MKRCAGLELFLPFALCAPCALCLVLVACETNDAAEPDVGLTQDAGSDALDISDAGTDVSLPDAGPDVSLPDAGPPPAFERAYPAAADMPAPDGFRWARSIVHLHSTHSHDACDGMPRPDGGFNEPCVADLRASLCTTRVDVAWLTDHPEHQVEVTFEEALLYDESEGDTLTIGADGAIANTFDCGDHTVMIRTGTEDELMPLGLERYVADTPEERSRIHNNRDEEAVAAFRSAGALIWQAHAEQRARELMLATPLDGFEVYQLHANIDPGIRRDFLGLDAFAPLMDLLLYVSGTPRAHPDLAVLLFLEENVPALSHWAAVLNERPVVGTGGTDAHQNVFSMMARDGERLDSYRRMISWFSNYLLVEGELSARSAQDALGAGRVVIGFDVLGDISGFDAWLEADESRYEIGSSIESNAGTLHVNVPALTGPDGVAALTGRVLRAVGDEWVLVGETFGAGATEVTLSEAGAYRVEVRTTGAHLATPAGEFADQIRDRSYPWIMSNAFRLGLPMAM